MKSGRRHPSRFTEDQRAYIRYLTQERWERIRDLWEAAATAAERQAALQELGAFPERGRYAALWAQQWSAFVADAAPASDPGVVFGRLEQMVWRSFEAEEAARQAEGGRSAFEEDDYFRFMAFRSRRLYEADAWEVGGFAEGAGMGEACEV
jgi:hypothetical protein